MLSTKTNAETKRKERKGEERRTEDKLVLEIRLLQILSGLDCLLSLVLGTEKVKQEVVADALKLADPITEGVDLSRLIRNHSSNPGDLVGDF